MPRREPFAAKSSELKNRFSGTSRAIQIAQNSISSRRKDLREKVVNRNNPSTEA
jgi:hypothetical protein